MKKKSGLMFIGLCLVISAGLVLVNFNQASFKVMAANEKASSFLSEGVTYDLLAGTTASIAGNISGKNHLARKGVKVTIEGASKIEKATTDANGAYAISGLQQLDSSKKKFKYTIKLDGKKKGSFTLKDVETGEVVIKNFKSNK